MQKLAGNPFSRVAGVSPQLLSKHGSGCYCIIAHLMRGAEERQSVANGGQSFQAHCLVRSDNSHLHHGHVYGGLSIEYNTSSLEPQDIARAHRVVNNISAYGSVTAS
jgi:hypothetical protein